MEKTGATLAFYRQTRRYFRLSSLSTPQSTSTHKHLLDDGAVTKRLSDDDFSVNVFVDRLTT